MSDVAIRVEGLSKQYRIGGTREPYKTLREALAEAVVSPVRRARSLLRGDAGGAAELDETIWALKDVSFEVKRGEVIGIIGRNGAGKSTLLKILSRITEPTEGRVELRGRVGSLLEVGTGFHHELTGRENIYLNGAILGMKRAEIEKKFDEIVAFAEIEKFLDTPVKHYSSGMYVRLAFAVAAHLEPEILLVDEVLAVGDVAFQKKCLGRIAAVAREGRTVMLVSHQMAAVSRLCERVLLLDRGRVQLDGHSRKAIEKYLSSGARGGGNYEWAPSMAPGDDSLRLRFVRVHDAKEHRVGEIDNTKDLYVEIGYEVLRLLGHVRVGFQLLTAEGVTVFDTNDQDTQSSFSDSRSPGQYVSRCRIPGLLLNQGDYTLTVLAHMPRVKVLALAERVLRFHVTYVAGAGLDPSKPGVIRPALEWTIEQVRNVPHG